MPGDESASRDPASDAPGTGAGTADRGAIGADPAGAEVKAPGGAIPRPAARPPWLAARRLRSPAGRWLSIFAVSLALFIVRFLVPAPVGQADNRDGPRLMCGLGVAPVTHGFARFFRYAYFEYVPSKACAGRLPYPSSDLVLLELARLLTPVLRLPGTLNLIAAGLLICVIASAGIASLATGLRLRLAAQLVIAAAAWLIMADAAFFDFAAAPFSEAAALVGLLLVAAGVIYLGRGRRARMLGLVLAGSGGFLAVLAKEQYLILAVPIGLALILASADRSRGRGLDRFRTRQAGAAVAVAALLATMTAAYVAWDYTSHYGRRLHNIQAVDMIFTDIVNKRATAPADLRALGLPVSWARYAKHIYWARFSVRQSPLYPRYAAQLTDGNIAHFLVTHPGSIITIGQQQAILAQRLQVTTLGDYPPDAGHPPGAIESREVVLTWLMHRLPPGLGLLWLLPLWTAMAAVAIVALRLRRGRPWHRDAAVLVLCMTGCAIAAFIPVAYFAGVATTRHMAAMNLATALAFLGSAALAVSMSYQALARARQRPPAAVAPDLPEPARPGS